MRATCESFLKSGADEVIVCADGTTDGSCDNLPSGARVVRNSPSLGCGKSKFKATLQASGDAIIWVDAHQCVLEGDIRSMAQRAVNNQTIVCPAIGNIFYTPDWKPEKMANSRLFYPNEDCLLPDSTAQYRFQKPDQTACVGVGLCMSRGTYLQTGGWNRFLGRHGSQERGMSLRAYMAGIPVEIDDSVVIGHEFFGQTHPSRNSSTGQYRFNNIAPATFNIWHAYMAVCGSQFFDAEIKPWLSKFKNHESASLKATTREAVEDRDHFLRHCKRRPDSELMQLIERLSSSRAVEKDPGTASLEPAAVRIIKSNARGRCLELGSGSGAGTKALLSGAMAVTSVDHMAKYTELARKAVPDERVEFITCSLNPETGFYDLSQVTGKFDLILIDGPPGGTARRNGIKTVLPLLSERGIILQDDAKRDLAGITAQCSGLNLKMLKTQRGMAMISQKTLA